jgi:hypothetical protein
MRAYCSPEEKMERCASGTVRRWALLMRRWKTTGGSVDMVWEESRVRRWMLTCGEQKGEDTTMLKYVLPTFFRMRGLH